MKVDAIVGFVRERPSGKPIPGARVRAYDRDAQTNHLVGEAVTAADGRFEIARDDCRVCRIHRGQSGRGVRRPAAGRRRSQRAPRSALERGQVAARCHHRRAGRGARIPIGIRAPQQDSQTQGREPPRRPRRAGRPRPRSRSRRAGRPRSRRHGQSRFSTDALRMVRALSRATRPMSCAEAP